ncbi:MAG: DMT family transporter [Lachnospiraceae bacterium]|nr:DMT family transporter [Lachnospiraceae bacterium]
MKNNRKVFGCVGYTALVFASMEPVSKLLNGQVNPFTLTFWRFLIGSAFVFPMAVREIRRKRLSVRARDIPILAVEGILIVCLSMGLLQAAVFRAKSAALIAVIYCTNSVFTVIFAACVLKETLTKRRAAAVALCLLGIYAGCGIRNREELFTVFLAFASALAMSLFTVLGKRLMDRFPTKVQIGISFPIGTAVLGLLELSSGVLFEIQVSGLLELLLILYLGVAVTGLGYLSYFWAMELSGAFMASLVFFIKPVLAPFMSLLILGTGDFSPTLFFSVALIVCGSLLVLSEKKEEKT